MAHGKPSILIVEIFSKYIMVLYLAWRHKQSFCLPPQKDTEEKIIYILLDFKLENKYAGFPG